MTFSFVGTFIPASALAFGTTPVGTLLSSATCRLTVQLIESVHQLRIEFDRLFTVGVTAVQIDKLRFGMVVCLHEHMLFQWYRTLFRYDQRGFATDGFNPLGKILDIGDRCGKTDYLHILRQVDDDFFPYRTSETVGEIMHFIENHITKRFKRYGMLIQHIAQHFGGHDHNVRFGIDRCVSGQQSNLIRAVLGNQIMILLIAQRLDRRGIESFDVPCLCQIDGEIRCNRLARAGRRRYEHIIPGLQCLVGL